MSGTQNSLQAYHEGVTSRKFSQREQMVIAGLRAITEGTDRQVLMHLGLTDMNQVRPRITNLIDLGVIEHFADTRCTVTGKTVRVVRLKDTTANPTENNPC